MITAAPTREREGYVRVGFAEFDEITTQAVYSGPISDRVAIRVAVDYKDTGDGWIDNLAPESANLMEGETTNARVKLAMNMSEYVYR